jgi:hypothetical protein
MHHEMKRMLVVIPLFANPTQPGRQFLCRKHRLI